MYRPVTVIDIISAGGALRSDVNATAAYNYTIQASAYAAAAALSASKVTIIPGPAELAAFDQNQNKWLSITPDVIQHSHFDSVVNRIAYTQGSEAFRLYDSNNNVWCDITPDRIRHSAFDGHTARLLALESKASQTAKDPQWNSIAFIGEIVGFICYGQSLSRGHSSQGSGGAGTVVSTTPSTTAYMFTGGMRPDDNSTVPATIYAGFVAAVESFVTTPTTGTNGGNDAETPLYGFQQMFAQLMREENGIDLAAVNQKHLLSGVGVGGTPVTGLVSSSGRWARLQEQFAYGKSVSDTAGKSFATGGMLVLQGETDSQNLVDPTVWANAWRGIRTDAETYARTQTGGVRNYPMFMYQMSTHPGVSAPTPAIGLMQLAMCISDQYFGFAGPTYHLPYNTGDIHLTGVGSKWIGAFMGLLAKRWLVDQIKPAPLLPTIRNDGNHIIAQYPVDSNRKITIDTVTVPAQSNFGMAAVESDGTTVHVLSNPRLSGQNTIVWDADATPANAWKFRYAWTGDAQKGLGNIRDDNPLIFDRTGLQLPMQKWAPIHEVILT